MMTVVTRAGLSTTGYNRWQKLVDGFSPRLEADPNNPLIAPAHIAGLLEGVARHLFFTPTCLERSIALCWLLRRRGFSAEVRIGGRKEDERFEAHAWVECEGETLDGNSDEQKNFRAFEGNEASVKREAR